MIKLKVVNNIHSYVGTCLVQCRMQINNSFLLTYIIDIVSKEVGSFNNKNVGM